MVSDIKLNQIDENYAHLRLANPKAEANLLKSVKQYGQLSPVIVFKISSCRYEMVDGFKRLRVCRKLNYDMVQAKSMDTKSRSLKAAMISMNWGIQSITDFEEGLVITSLHREDLLNQTQIATLLGRHKSWVCRRIALIERLSDEVLDHIKLGLINPTIGRELSKLPRGNQELPLQTILEHRLTTRQTANLVTLLQKEPKNRYEPLLNDLSGNCLEKMNASNIAKADGVVLQDEKQRIESFCEKLLAIDTLLRLLLKELGSIRISERTCDEQSRIAKSITRMTQSFDTIRSKLMGTIKRTQTAETNLIQTQ
ncbi:MAG: ParB N-terminal domain-containing protein [SAR324 cluster bacterium]|nr:ParB N-terminal domain-containing protein [SAR324 cluster bacterium]